MPAIELISKVPEAKDSKEGESTLKNVELVPVGISSAEEDLPEKKVSTHSSTDSEVRASTLGWMPKEKWVEAGHEESDWKPAKVFLEHGDMIGRIRNQSKEIDDMRKALTYAQQQNIQVYEKGYNQALLELKAQKRQALAVGDLVKADEINDQIDATNSQIQQIKQQTQILNNAATPKQQQVDPEHIEWVGRNPWYNTNSALAAAADRKAQDFIRERNGNTTATEVRAYVERAMREEFPEKIAPRPKAAPSPDGESRSTGSTRSASNGSLDSKLSRAKADMTDEQRSIMKTILKSTGMTEKKYLELYSH
jgi:hypothetical protein